MAFLAILAGMLIPILLTLSLIILIIVGQWKTNKKASRPGWHSLIPILSQYTRASIGGDLRNFKFLLIGLGASMLCGLLGVVLGNLISASLALIGGLLSLPFAIMAIVFAIKIENSVSHAFGKSGGFTAGLIFLPFVFNPILGFGKAEHGDAPAVAPKEPKPKKEKPTKAPKTPKTKKEPKVKKEKNAKGKKAQEIIPEPEQEEEPSRPVFVPQYDMGEEEPPAPRMTMDQMMLQSLKAKKAPPAPVEEPKPVPTVEPQPEMPSNRFSIPVEYVPEKPTIEVPQSDYLIPAFARPDYQPAPPAPPTPPVVETPAPVTQNNGYAFAPAYESGPTPQYKQAPQYQPAPQYEAPAQYEETYPQAPAEQEVDPFTFFGLPAAKPAPKKAPVPPAPPVQQPMEQPVVPVQPTQPPVQSAPVWQEPVYAPQYEQPVIEPVYQAPAAPVAPPEPVQSVVPTPSQYEQPAQSIEQPVLTPVQIEAPLPLFSPQESLSEPAPLQGTMLDIPGFSSGSGSTNAGFSAPPQPYAAPTPAYTPPAPVAAPIAAPVAEPTTFEQRPVEVAPSYEERPMPPAAPVAPPAIQRPAAPPQFVAPAPVENKKPIDDDDDELPPPPVVKLPPRKSIFRKSTAIDRFHNEDGGLK